MEEKIEFKKHSELKRVEILEEGVDKPLIVISGYDLQIGFNLELINDISDIDEATKGIASVFKDLLYNQLISQKNN